jgi:Adenylate and Guanylate cyclase catalytic domain
VISLILVPFRDDHAAQLEAEIWARYYTDFCPGEDPLEPVLDIVYPIIDDVSTVELSADEDYNPNNHTPVGMIVASAYWRKLIRNILQPESTGMIIVINNDCAIPFTYQINGPNSTYLGVFDNHDNKYDHMLVSAELIDISTSNIVDSVYSGASVNKEFCQYTMHLYPSDDMRANFTTKNAFTYTAISCVLFFGLAIIFVLYDSKVERRQKKVLSSAVRTSEIVSSLFPSSVQDQLYAFAGVESDGQNTEKHRGNPIATLYPDTTVMFADIKGFTAWSTTREPTQVFQLLETLYCEFDKLTKVFGVFKVETIGDTYVAVVGLPAPRENHAIVMAVFAKKCIDKMAVRVKELEAELGEVSFKRRMWLSK